MSSPPATSDDLPRYATLRDYMGVLRRHRVVIAVVTVAFAAAGLLISLAQDKKYEATSSLTVQDVSQLGGGVILSDVAPSASGPVLAQRTAALADRYSVAKQVKKDLKGTNLTIAQLQSAMSATVGTQTQLVDLTAEATTAKLSARISNAFADQVAKAGRGQVSRTLERIAVSLEKQIDKLKGSTDTSDVIRRTQFEQRVAEIRALQDASSQTVQVVERAQVPDGPSSPDTARNVGLGALVGLFFGLLGAFLRDSLDRRLHTVHEIHQEIGLPVLGRVSDTAMGYPGLAGNGRVSMADSDFEAFRILRTNLGALGGGGAPRCLMVTSGLPEEGKSTVSMSLASAAAIAGQRVLLVECDLRRPSFATRLNVKRSPGLSDYLIGKAGPQEVLQTVDLREPAAFADGQIARRSTQALATLVAISAGTPVTNPAELLISERFKDFLAKVSKAYDLVVLDTSPLLAVADPMELMPQVDGVLVCVRAQQATREEARATRAALGYAPDMPIGAVATGLRRGSGDSYDYYYGY